MGVRVGIPTPTPKPFQPTPAAGPAPQPLVGGMVPDWMFGGNQSWPTPPAPQAPLMGGLVPDSMFGGGAPDPMKTGGIPTPQPRPQAPAPQPMDQRDFLARLLSGAGGGGGRPGMSHRAEAAGYTTSGTDRSKGAGMGSSARSNKGGGLY